MTYTKKPGDKRFYDAAKQNVDRYVTANGEILTYEPEKYNLDMICMGRSALRLYKATGDERYEKACRRLTEQLRHQPTTPEGGFWHKKLYPEQMWLDGIYMACPFMAEFAAAFGEAEWADMAVKQMTLIYEKTRLASGLHAHAWDSAKAQKWADPQTGLSPHVWGRAMGWFVMAHARRAERIAQDASGLCEARRTDEVAAGRGDGGAGRRPALASGDGHARKRGELCGVLLLGDVHLRLCRGAELGLCGEEAVKAARESMDALWEKNVVIAADGYPELTKICKVAGLGGEPYRSGSYSYYINEVVCSGDTKGTAPFLMACCALGA